MKLRGAILICLLSCAGAPAADDLARRAWEMERGGDATGARDLLQRSAQDGKNAAVAAPTPSSWIATGPGARAAYQKLILNPDLSAQDRAVIARRLTTLDLLAGDREPGAASCGVFQGGRRRPLAIVCRGGERRDLCNRDPRTVAVVCPDGSPFPRSRTGGPAPCPGS